MIHIMDFSILICLILSMASSGSSNVALNGRTTTFNVLDFGAIGDGVTDDSQAFLKAWNAVCTARTTSAMLIIQRKKTFLLSPTVFSGPCKPPQIHVLVLGDITAPKTRSAWGRSSYWLIFQYIDGFIINGKGTLDGQGSSWWPSLYYKQELLNDTNSYDMDDVARPIALGFSFCNNLQIYGLNVINSPSKHVKLFRCNGAILSNLNIKAPKESPNTDGIVIGECSQIQVHDNNIGTGDDCVAILKGSSNINISRVACGPGHGISIGSLGMNGAYDTVEEIHVQDCSFTGTQNGIRIKTWQGGSGYARKISFQGITLNAAENPIIIDQYYCPQLHCPNKTSAVKVSDISYAGVQGTSMTKTAINLRCSQSMACTNIELKRINITSVGQKFVTSSFCLNAHGRASRSIPNLRCLMK
ncbi:probable polygalacturonase At3g15720 [Vitis vinifera]|uniref:probable polygalacturonase At3g15720 n=1 Tax=Vitis vinifera TaxID=29760 RepID=UPI00053F70A4|nr:probable polygalacturonase At3g15720 [Vitis vinifera]|eukprot:XP_010654779.1 PREDICTED: probable polygalacturonase At3g15720 [Vitis vinifera]